jgi:dTMP kinase
MGSTGGASRGRFISFEGPEGAGKTTQVETLRVSLEAEGRTVVVVREPGGTPAGERIRSLLLDAGSDGVALLPRTDALLFNAARAQLVADVIEPALAAGTIVISDRFADSTVAYQGYAAGLPIEDLRAIERFAVNGVQPDLTILLDLPADTGLRRKAGEETRFETTFDTAFHERVRQGFLSLASEDASRFAIVDARLAPDEVARAVRQAAERLLGARPHTEAAFG